MLGKLLCWLGFHDWYQGRTHMYCMRTDCEVTESFHEDDHE